MPYAIDVADLLPAERRLLDAAIAGQPCVLNDLDVGPPSGEIAGWNDFDREIRAEVLALLITDQILHKRIMRVSIQGAIITGCLTVKGTATVVPFASTDCSYEAVSMGRGVTFSGDVSFTDVTFSGDIWFGGAEFSGDARFEGANFSGDASYAETTFNRDVWFDGATFTKNAAFDEATFGRDARFGGDAALAGEVVFSGDVSFANATFSGNALFERATFKEAAEFSGATFAKDAWFDSATFAEEADFSKVTFTDPSSLFLNAVVGEAMVFRRARFNGPIDGVWAARTVVFDEARFMEPASVRVLSPRLSLINAELRSGGTLRVRGGIDSTAATFGARTTISDSGAEDWLGLLAGPHELMIGDETVLLTERADLAADLMRELATPTSVRSLRRATVADLELSAVDLTDCHFAGAHGLDKMRIDSTCTLATTPGDTAMRRPLRFTHRNVIAEEREWRERYSAWGKPSNDSDDEPADTDLDESADVAMPPDAAAIAGIYRSLRKGLEDASNEPGAADFYYGEMEMRRLARRAPTEGPKPSLIERWLLTAYWAVSGYGLRAWRAFTAIGVVIAVATVLFATVGVDDPPGMTERVSWVQPISGEVSYEQVQKASFGWWDSFELAARNSVMPLRNPGNTPSLTPIGTLTDIAVRLLVPALLALAVLAIRGRTKR